MSQGRGVGLLAAAMLLATACGGVGSSGTPSGSKAVTTMGFGLPDEHATARVDAFKKAHPDITVKVNEGAFDEQQFLSAVASGNPPDIVYLEHLTNAVYLDRNRDTVEYLEIMDNLCIQAQSPSVTIGFLRRVINYSYRVNN